MADPILGIDVGGSGIKGNLVDLSSGLVIADRHRIATPQPATPDAVAGVIAEIAKHFEYEGKIGCTMPSVVQQGIVKSAANIDDAWIGVNGDALFEQSTGLPVTLMNDADAAGIAEMKYGVGKDQAGVVFMLTFGTGIGTAVFSDGKLVPNTELGHIEFQGDTAERQMSAKVKEDKDLSYKKWGKLVNKYLQYLEFLFSPTMFIIGGGISKRSEKFFHHLETNAKVVPAKLLNDAGIVGAAWAVGNNT